MVRPAGSVAEYQADPAGRYLAGRSFFHFFARPDLCGLVLWGRPDVDDVQVITGALEAETPEHSGVHSSIVDARRLVDVDSAGFELLVDYFRRRSAVIAPNVEQHAMVRPAGVVGAIVAGFWNVAPSIYPDRTRIFAQILEALSWLGCPDGPALLDEIDCLHSAISGTPRAVQALRDHAATHPRTSLAQAARIAGISARSLQDQLKSAGTTFRRELNAARVRAAQVMMATSDSKLTSIAAEVGCASVQHFSTLFRKQTGVAPSAWRALHRR